MAKYTDLKNNFSAGELSTKLEGRTELQEYTNGLKEMFNFFPYKTGGASRRPGSRLVADLQDLVSASFTPTDIIDFRIGSRKYLVVIDATPGDNMDVQVFEVTAGISDIDMLLIDRSISYEAGNFSDSILPTHVQVGNKLFICDRNGDTPPLVIFQDLDDSFRIETYAEYVERQGEAIVATAGVSRVRGTVFPALNISDTTVTITVNGAGYDYNLTFSEEILYPRFDSTSDLGYIRVSNGSTESIFHVKSGGSSTTLWCDLVLGTVISGTHRGWAMQSWIVGDYPRAVGYYQGRLIFGGNNSQPDTIWCSYAQNLTLLLNYKLAQDTVSENSGVGYWGEISDADAFDIFLSADIINQVQWITSDKVLQVGMDSNEHYISTVDGKFGPSNYDIATSTFYGSDNISSVRFQNSNYIVEKDGRSVRELTYSDENGSNISRLVSALADEVLDFPGEDAGDATVRDMIINRTRSAIFIVTDTNNLVGVTIEKATGVLAWHQHEITGADVISVASLQGFQDKREQLFLLTERNGKQYIEYIGAENEASSPTYPYTELNRTVYLDFQGPGLALDSTTILVPLQYPIGDTVAIFSSGEYLGEHLVEAHDASYNKVTGLTDVPADNPFVDEIRIGYRYTSRLETLPVEAGSQVGNSNILYQRNDTALLKLYKSLGGQAGATKLYDIIYPSQDEYFTGNKRIQLDSNPDEDQTVIIETDSPHPLNILSIGLKGLTQD